MREFITRFNKEEIGFDVAIVSDIPIERGMGVPASIGTAMSLFLEHALMVVQSPEERSTLCVSAERQFVSSSVDSVGAFTSSCSQEGSLLLVNPRTNEGEWMPLDASICLLVCKCASKKGAGDSNCSSNANDSPSNVNDDSPSNSPDPCTIATTVTATTTTTTTTTTILATLQTSYPQLASLSDATPDQVEAMKKELGDAYPCWNWDKDECCSQHNWHECIH